MGVLPKDICNKEECLKGCVVSENGGWVVKCVGDKVTCESLSGPNRACIWEGHQSGGLF